MKKFKIGERVRSHDFEDRTRPTRGECYCEGVIEDIRNIDGQGDRYLIAVERRMWDGEEIPVASHEEKVAVLVALNFIEQVGGAA